MDDKAVLLKFASENPQDPRSAKILGHFGFDQQHMEKATYPGQMLSPTTQLTGAEKGLVNERGKSGLAATAGVALPAAGTAIGTPAGPFGAMAGAAGGNMLAGQFRRWLYDQPTTAGDVGMDAAWGAAPVALTKGIGAIAARRGAPGVGGILSGEPTADMAAKAGPDLSGVTDPALRKVTTAASPGGSQVMATNLANKGEAALTQANAGLQPPQPPIRMPTDWMPFAGGAEYWPRTMPTKTLGSMADNVAGLRSYAAPTGIRGAISDYVGRLVGGMPGRSIGAMAGGAASNQEGRFLSAAAQAEQRGLPLVPELKQALQSVPGQTAASPTVSQAFREYMQRGE